MTSPAVLREALARCANRAEHAPVDVWTHSETVLAAKYDVPRLVAAVEAVIQLCEESDGLWQHDVLAALGAALLPAATSEDR